MRAGFPLPDVTWEPLRPLWAAAARGELHLPRCSSCARICWYPETCPDCGETTFSWEPMSGRGRLFTWVVVRHAFLPQYKGLVPFVSALVTLEEDERVRLATRIVDAAPADLRIGQPVEVCFQPLSFDGVDGTVPAPFFRPAAT